VATATAEAEFCFFDLQTTGFDPARGDDVVQIGAVKIAAAR
jgi:DNA polymerase III epsilon subunit-like protein